MPVNPFDRDFAAANAQLAKGWHAKQRSAQAQLRAVQLEIARIKDAQARTVPDPLPNKRYKSHGHPCPRCGRAQPLGQSPADIAAYAQLEPTAVLYVRADGCIRAHDATCDLIDKRRPYVPPDPHPEDVNRHVPDTRGVNAAPIGEPNPVNWYLRRLQRGWRPHSNRRALGTLRGCKT